MRRAGLALLLALLLPGAARAEIPGGLTPIVSGEGCLLRSLAEFSSCAPLPGPQASAPRAIAISANGQHVYVASREAQSVRLYRRDPATGGISAVPGAEGCLAATDTADGCEATRGLNRPWDLALSPDGEHLYVANPDLPGGEQTDAVVTIDIDPATGAMTERLTCRRDDAATISCSIFVPDQADVATLGAPTGIAVSPDGKNVYVAGGEGITVFDRGANGSLDRDSVRCLNGSGGNGCQLTDDLPGSDAHVIAVSPDGRTVAVGTGFLRDFFFPESGKTVLAFRRDLGDGDLTQLAGGDCVSSGAAGCTDVDAMVGISSLAFSADGAHLYAAAFEGNAVVPIRVTAPGEISPVTNGCVGEAAVGCLDSGPLNGPFDLAVAPDGEHVYVAARDSQALRVLRRRSDGGLEPVAAGGCLARSGSVCPPAPAVGGIEGVAVSPEGRTVYSTATYGLGGYDGIGAHKRDIAAPDCADGAAVTGHNQATTLLLPCSDADDKPVLEIVAGSPSGGLGAIDQNTRTVAFSPLPGFSGRTTFTYRATAGTRTTRTATFTVDVAAAPIALERILSTIQNKWAYNRRLTKIITLKVRDVPAGATVEVRCIGGRTKRCSFKRRTVAPRSRSATVDVRKLFKKKTTLKVGAKIELRITKPAAIGRYVAYTMRAGKIPKLTTRCLPPGSSKPGRC